MTVQEPCDLGCRSDVVRVRRVEVGDSGCDQGHETGFRSKRHLGVDSGRDGRGYTVGDGDS